METNDRIARGMSRVEYDETLQEEIAFLQGEIADERQRELEELDEEEMSTVERYFFPE